MRWCDGRSLLLLVIFMLMSFVESGRWELRVVEENFQVLRRWIFESWVCLWEIAVEMGYPAADCVWNHLSVLFWAGSGGCWATGLPWLPEPTVLLVWQIDFPTVVLQRVRRREGSGGHNDTSCLGRNEEGSRGLGRTRYLEEDL